MARTKQTAKRTVGGLAPRQALATVAAQKRPTDPDVYTPGTRKIVDEEAHIKQLSSAAMNQYLNLDTSRALVIDPELDDLAENLSDISDPECSEDRHYLGVFEVAWIRYIGGQVDSAGHWVDYFDVGWKGYGTPTYEPLSSLTGTTISQCCLIL